MAKRINRLLIDSSSVLMACLFAARSGENAFLSEFEGKEEKVPSALDGYEIFLGSLDTTMYELDFVPSQIILVKDGKGSRQLRQAEFPPYKLRPKKNPDFLKQFNKMQSMAEETLWSYGALSVEKEGYEADDLLAALWSKGDWIWSKDGDLIAAGDWYYSGNRNPDKFLGIEKKHIVVYKSLVGDTSDKIPGAKGFGKQAFIDMVTKYDYDVCDDILDMLENRKLKRLKEYEEEFKPFKKIIEFEQKVYQSYFCARFHHPGWSLDWQLRFPETNGDMPKWDRSETLMGADTLNLAEIVQRLASVRVGFIGLDIETYEDEESLEWGIRNKSTTKGPKLDIYGSHMTGLSLTCGENNQHVYYFPVDHKDTDNLTLEQLTEVLNLIPKGVDVLVHNALFELPVVRMHCDLRFDRGWLPNVLDTQIEKSYENENELAGLKFCTKKHMQYDQTSYEEVITKITILCDEHGEGQFVHTKYRMNELTGEEVVSYGADDAVVTCGLHAYFRAVMDYEGTSDAFDQCEQWSAYMFAEAFLNGIRFDMNRLAELTEINRKAREENKSLVDSQLMKIKGFPGTEYLPLTKLTSPEIKRVFAIYSGIKLKTRLRSLTKLGALIEKEGKIRFGKAVADGDIEGINDLALSVFEPKPELNLGSPKQKTVLMYELLGLPIRIYGKVTDKMKEADPNRKQGNPKANEAAIRMAVINDATDEVKDLLEAILAGVELNTEYSLFLHPYKEMPNPKDDMVHYGTGHSKTTSRRNAPNGPNIGQVSKKSPIREIYAAYEDGMVWISCDESGQELLLTAFRSGCEAMRACYPWDGPALDVHSKTGVEIAALEGIDISYEEFNKARKDPKHPKHKICKDIRNRKAKAVNFGDVYNQQKQGLALKLMITEEKAEAIMEAKAKTFPGVAKWKVDTKERHRRDGFAITLLGARKHLRLDGTWKDEQELRSGTNFEIQSPASEQLKIIASKFWKRELFERFNAVYHFPVHDEQNASCSKEDAADFIEEFHSIMVEPYGGMDLPIRSSIEIGRNFGELIELGEEFDEGKIMSVINSL